MANDVENIFGVMSFFSDNQSINQPTKVQPRGGRPVPTLPRWVNLNHRLTPALQRPRLSLSFCTASESQFRGEKQTAPPSSKHIGLAFAYSSFIPAHRDYKRSPPHIFGKHRRHFQSATHIKALELLQPGGFGPLTPLPGGKHYLPTEAQTAQTSAPRPLCHPGGRSGTRNLDNWDRTTVYSVVWPNHHSRWQK